MAGRIERAMVLAAGRGVRLRPLTDHLPKPLVPIGGIAMLDRALDALARAGVSQAVVNVHHLALQIEARLATREKPAISISREDELLETGGGIAKAISHFDDEPFFAANADIVWLDGKTPALARLAEAWDGGRMDALLLVQPVARAVGYDGVGDFTLTGDGRLERRGSAPSAPFVFAGVQILHPRLFENAPSGAFSLNLLYDRAHAAGRLFGLAHDGGWLHVGTMDGLAAAERALVGQGG
ncbi:MAG: nucleotidyltransferase family protein [Alphaproteobacteria bacterium]|nr:nucleotidyltransferase family protein [Alphaproteobacteria bacterium]